MSNVVQMESDVEELVEGLARAGRAAQRKLARMSDADKARALRAAAACLRTSSAAILAANAQDLANGKAAGLSGAMLDRLRLDEERLEGVAAA
ncbi:MAG: gamma-glutamyl-phosphate reductase, partial [Gammaproteobacteria bacterium]|nr:gamma-glutamyl-phosphate reductase [Gammaproteobacteria bacterium]